MYKVVTIKINNSFIDLGLNMNLISKGYIMKSILNDSKYCARLKEYRKANDFELEFLFSKNMLCIRPADFSIGDTLLFRYDEFKSSKFIERFESIFVVVDITDEFVELIQFESLFKAESFKKKNMGYAF